MPTSEPSPGRKALDYAEETLGVHKVYEQALEARAVLDKSLTDLSYTRDLRRELESKLQDAKMEVAAEERGRHPDMSATAMEQHLKVAFNQSDIIRELNEQLGKVISDAEGLEMDRQVAETDIKISIARMHELGGYMSYLAEIKRHSA